MLQAASMELIANFQWISLTGIRTGKESERCMSKLETSTLNNAHAAEPQGGCDCLANNQDFREFTAGNKFLCCTKRTVAGNLEYYTDGITSFVDNSESFLTTRFTTRMLFHIHEFIQKVQKGEVDNGEDPLNNCSQQLADTEKFEAFPASNRRSEPSACNSKDDAKVVRNDCTHLVAGNEHMEAFPDVNRRIEASAQSSEDAAEGVRNDCTHLVAGNEHMEAFLAANRRSELSACRNKETGKVGRNDFTDSIASNARGKKDGKDALSNANAKFSLKNVSDRLGYKVFERIQYSSVATRIDACNKNVSIENIGDGKSNVSGINAARDKNAVWKRARVAKLANENVLGARQKRVSPIAARIEEDGKVVADSNAASRDLKSRKFENVVACNKNTSRSTAARKISQNRHNMDRVGHVLQKDAVGKREKTAEQANEKVLKAKQTGVSAIAARIKRDCNAVGGTVARSTATLARGKDVALTSYSQMLKHHFELKNVKLEVLTLKTLVKFELDGRDVLCFSTSKTSRYEISEKTAHFQMLEQAFDADSNKNWISMQATLATLKMQTQFVLNRRFVYFKNRKLADNRKVFVAGDEQRRRRQRGTEQISVVKGMQNPDHGFSVGCNLRARRQVTLVRWRTKDSRSIEEPRRTVQIDIEKTFGSRENFSRGNCHVTTSETCLSGHNASGLNC